MTELIHALMRPFRGQVALLFGLSLGAVAIDVIPPMLQRLLVDRVLRVDMPQEVPQQLLLLLMSIVGGLLLVRLASATVGVWKGWVSSRVGAAMTSDLRNALVKKLNELPLAFYDCHQTGKLMSQVAYDTETLHTLIYHITSGFLLQSLQLVGIGVMLFYLNAKLALITMLPMPLIVAGGWYFTRYLNPLNQHYWDAVGRQASSLMGTLSGIRVVKAFVQEDREIRRFCRTSARLRDSRLTVDVSSSTFTALMGLLFALGTLAVWYLGGRDVLAQRMTLGSLMAFLSYLAMFYTPLTSIAESTTWFANFYGTIQRIAELLAVPSEVDEPAPATPAGRIQGQVEFQRVSFGYDKARPVLTDISLAIEPGEMVGVVGRSGSGKSTLVSLIGRLYEVDSGSVLVDGVDVRQMNPRQLRRQIGMVPQEPFLFRGAVAENITYGDAQATVEQILRAAQQADAHNFIVQMPLAYETQLGEGGTGLSGGERQRLSIARALLFDPAILILDEATASVDAESERAICQAVRRGCRQRTTIVIAHRLSTLQGADRLLVFDQGRLIEQGTHRQLLAVDGLYSTLARLQWNMQQTHRRVESAAGSGAKSGGEKSTIDSDPADNPLLWFPVAGGQATAGNGSGDGRGSAHEVEAREDLERQSCWLDAAAVAIEDDGPALRVAIDGQSHTGVYAVGAFPASHPRSYISLRRRALSGRESDLGTIRDLDRWSPSAQQCVERSLRRRYRFHRVSEIRQIRAVGNLLTISVSTDDGPARLQVEKASQGSQPVGADGLLLTEGHGDYYLISQRSSLPKAQQRLLDLYFGD